MAFLLFWVNSMLVPLNPNTVCNIEIHSQGFLVEILSHLLSFDFQNLTIFFYVREGMSYEGKYFPSRSCHFPSRP